MTQELIILISLLLGIMMILFIFPYLGYYIDGWMPSMRARVLTSEKENDIRVNGIAHCTSARHSNLILKSRIIKSSSRLDSYSNHLKRSSFFFFGHLFAEGLRYNLSKKKSEVIILIRNLTEEQISRLAYRKYDNAVIYTGDFVFDELNAITIVKVDSSPKKTYFHFRVICISIFSFGMAAVVVLISIILLHRLLSFLFLA